MDYIFHRILQIVDKLELNVKEYCNLVKDVAHNEIDIEQKRISNLIGNLVKIIQPTIERMIGGVETSTEGLKLNESLETLENLMKTIS